MFSGSNPHNQKHYIDMTINHYTAPKTLVSILESNQLWLSKINNMRNDKSEGQYILKVYEKVIKKLSD